MRAILTTLIIFTIIVSIGAGQFCMIKNFTENLNSHVNTIDDTVRNKDPVMLLSALNDAQKDWTRIRFLLSLIVKHEYIFEVDSALTELFAFSQSFDASEATLSVSKMRAGISCIYETTAFTLENLI